MLAICFYLRDDVSVPSVRKAELSDPVREFSLPETQSGKPENAASKPIKNNAIEQSLLDLVPFMDFYRDGPVLDFAGTSYNYRAEAGAWEKDGDVGRRLVGPETEISVYFPGFKRYQLELRAKAGSEGQSVAFRIGDEDSVSVVLDSLSWKNYRLDLDSWGTLFGYQTIHVKSTGKSKPSLAFLHFHSKADSQSDNKTSSFVVAASESQEAALVLPYNGMISLPFAVPENVQLTWRTLFTRQGNAEIPASFLIRVLEVGEAEKLLYARPLLEASDDGQEVSRLDLEPFGGKIIRMEFILEDGDKGDQLRLVNPSLVRKQNIPEPSPWIPPENVIVYLVDTWRWDKLGFTALKGNTIHTPNFDRIAKEGVVFDNAIAQGCWSKPSQAAIQGGRYPKNMNMQKAEDHPKKDVELLASAIKKARPEVVTASFSSNGYVSDRFGFAQKWDYSRNLVRENLPSRAEHLLRTMVSVWERDNLVNKPFFIWFGTIDPHVPYSPPKNFVTLYDPDPYHGPIVPINTHFQLPDIKSGKLKLTARDWKYLKALYDGEVSYADQQFGRLLDQLKQWGILEKTAIIVVSDHGDEFKEHGGMGHAHTLYDEITHVPLLFYYPRGFPTPRVVNTSVETMSIYPTVLELLGISSSKLVQGATLIPYLSGREPMTPRVAYSSNGADLEMLAIGDWRMILKNREAKLFDTRNDPYQEKDLAKTRPDVVYYLLKRYREWKVRFEP